MSARVNSKDLARIQKKLKSIEDKRLYRKGLMAGGLAIKGHIAKYPPDSEANRPAGPGSHWYVRGQGGRYWRKRDGGISQYKTSQDLADSWTVRAEKGGDRVIVGTNVTYAPYVQDPDKQVSFHRDRGWQTTEDIARKYGDEVIDAVVQQLRKVLR